MKKYKVVLEVTMTGYAEIEVEAESFAEAEEEAKLDLNLFDVQIEDSEVYVLENTRLLENGEEIDDEEIVKVNNEG